MSPRRRLCALAVVSAAALAVPVLASPAAAAPAQLPGRFAQPVYLALGDSVAAGVGALPYQTGYPELARPQIAADYNTAAGKATPGKTTALALTNMSVGGATTGSLLSAQIGPALALIAERQADRDPFNDVEVITVTIGGNDVFTPVAGACILTTTPTSCQAVTAQRLQVMAAGVASALQQLAAAAPRADVVVTTYYNPIGSCVLTALNPYAPAIADVVLEGGSFGGFLTIDQGMNDLIRAAAVAAGADVAELYGAVTAGQFVGGTDCLHPNASGHQTIAGVVAATVAA